MNTVHKLKSLNLLSLIFLLAFSSCKKDLKPIMDFSNPDIGNGSEDVEVPTLENSTRPILLSEQSQGRAMIVDSLSQGIMWQWKASDHLSASQANWFQNIDEAKAVYNRKYVLITASSGGVALVRVSDKKIMFYTNAKGSPHSAEILPDGNIVVASSTDGSIDGDALKIYVVDSLNAYVPNEKVRYTLRFGHNVVWDSRRELLWATDSDYLYSYTYTNSGDNPQLTRSSEIIPVPDSSPHDLFPQYGQDALYLTTATGIYVFDIVSKKFTVASFSRGNIKSVSSGPGGFGTLLLLPNESYWSNEVINSSGNRAYYMQGLRIYKARWFINNTFSYPENHQYSQTK